MNEDNDTSAPTSGSAHNCPQVQESPLVTEQLAVPRDAGALVILERDVTLRYDQRGGVDVMLDDWVYVHINYDYRFTDNASRASLANEIVRILKSHSVARNHHYATGVRIS